MFRVMCGWDRRQAEAAEVFLYSVRMHTSVPVEDRFTGGETAPPWFRREGVTQFSYSRFLVPWLCNYEGRACYADGCDQLCLGDVAELASFDLQGKPLAVVKHPAPKGKDRARSWTSLMLMDCAKLTCWTPEVVETAPDDRLMRLRDFSDEEIGELPAAWNVLMAQRASPTFERSMLEQDGSFTVPVDFASYEPSTAVQLAHWSYLSDPNGGSWIDRSGSALWQEWRERWRAER